MLERAALITALSELAHLLNTWKIPTRVHIVGGAALALEHDPERLATRDVDAWILSAQHHGDTITNAIEHIAAAHNWPKDWLNESARIFIPNEVGSDTKHWITVHEIGVVTTLVASAELLLVMKLRAARGRRDLPDASTLQRLLNLTADDIATLYDHHYPDDPLSARARVWLERLRSEER